ncbi:MAG: SH3 domain-containing protein [Thermoanaerobaculia bacterium]
MALAVGCATPTPPPVDLSPARKAVEEAGAAAKGEEARAAALRARERLGEAEALAASAEPVPRRRAEDLGELAATEARYALLLDEIARRSEPAPCPPAAADPETEKLKARLRKAAEEQKRLEERVAVLQRDLEATETEVIRTKARLKGIETKAEASSAIAEAHTLLLRRKDEKARAADLSRASDKLERAERQLREGNYGAAVFFALQAQELLDQESRSSPAASGGTSAARPGLEVAASSALVRNGPRGDAPVVGRLPRGTRLEPLEERDGWVRVESGAVKGWVSRSVLR